MRPALVLREMPRRRPRRRLNWSIIALTVLAFALALRRLAAMTIDWWDPKAKLPDQDGEQCLLMPHDHGGLVTVRVFGPIAWHANSGAWLDLFATPEAGEIIHPAQVGCWTPWAPIAPRPEEDGCPNDPP